MKKQMFFYSAATLNKTATSLLLLTLLIAGIFNNDVNAQVSPFEKLKTVSQAAPILKMSAPGVAISPASPVLKTNTRVPISFKPFELKDNNGRIINPNEKVTLKNGKTITAKAAIDELNAIEKKLNAQGYSLRNGGTVNASEVVTNKEDLDGKVSMTPISSPLKTTAQIKQTMATTKKVGDVVLKPFHEYSAQEKKNLQGLYFNQENNQLKVQKLAQPMKIVKGIFSNMPLKTINETSSNDWSFGSSNTFKAGIHGELTRYARIYRFDPANPFKNASDFKVKTNAFLYADVFGSHTVLMNGTVDLMVPQDTSKKMKANITVSALGLTILNLRQEYVQHKEISGFIGRSFEKSTSVSVHIVGPIDVTAKVGIRGRVGIEYSGLLYRTFVSLTARPLAEVSGYIEVGVGIGTAHIGAGSNLTFVKGHLDLEAFAGIWIQNASQIVAAVSYYFGYDLTILKGNLYAYAEICLPSWLGGGCARYTTTLFNWSGFSRSGTIAEDTKTYVIANL